MKKFIVFLLMIIFIRTSNIIAIEPLELATKPSVSTESMEPIELYSIETIQNLIDAFYTDKEKCMLSDSITQEKIDKVKSAIAEVKPKLKKDEKIKLIDIIFDLKNVEKLFEVKNITNSLFDSNGFVINDPDFKKAQIAVSILKEEYPDFYEKEVGEITKAENQKKEVEEIAKLVNTLFTDESRNNVIEDVTRDKLNQVLSVINAMTITPYKEKFTSDLAKVENVIAEKERAIIEAEPKYLLRVSKSTHKMVVYSKDPSGNYTVPKAEFVVSTGRTPGMTPVGRFTLGDKEEWHQWYSGGTVSPYTIPYANGLYIHGPIYTSRNFNSIIQSTADNVGQNVTSGCVRSTTAVAKYIYDNCVKGTILEITN